MTFTFLNSSSPPAAEPRRPPGEKGDWGSSPSPTTDDLTVEDLAYLVRPAILEPRLGLVGLPMLPRGDIMDARPPGERGDLWNPVNIESVSKLFVFAICLLFSVR